MQITSMNSKLILLFSLHPSCRDKILWKKNTNKNNKMERIRWMRAID